MVNILDIYYDQCYFYKRLVKPNLGAMILTGISGIYQTPLFPVIARKRHIIPEWCMCRNEDSYDIERSRSRYGIYRKKY